MEAEFGPQRHGHHRGAGGADHPLIGRVDRLGHDDLVAGAGEALHRAIEAALRAGHEDDIVGGAALARPRGMARRDRRPQRRLADKDARNSVRPARNAATVARRVVP